MARYAVNDNLLSALIKQESGGNNNAVSPVGARGVTQVMPKTGRDPGFGVQPMRDQSEGEYRRFGRDYLGAMLNRYNGDLNKALAAYNAGPGTVDKAGGVPNIKETQNYVKNIMKTLNPMGEASASERPYTPPKMTGLPEGFVIDGAPAAQPKASGLPEGFTIDKAESSPEQSGRLAHKAEVGARGVLEGAAGIPGQLYNAGQMAPNAIAKYIEEKTGFRHPILDSGAALPASVDTAQYGKQLATSLGLDEPTASDNIVYPVGKAIGGYVVPATGMAKLGSGAIKAGGAALGGNAPIASIAGIVGGKSAAEVARQSGASPNMQMAADIAGNIAGGAGVGIINATGRTASRAGKAALGTGLEGVAGRTLNRAAGDESPQIIENLATGKVPTIAKSIKGYQPTASEIAGNPGVSTIMRQTGMDVDSLSLLGARKFQNTKAISDYAEKAAGSSAKRGDMQTKGFAAIDEITVPMRQRNAPVDLTPVRSSIDAAIERHTGNKGITKALESLKKDLPTGDTAGFNEVYNFKQYLDETLRGNAMSDPKVASMQRAASALKETKKALADTLTETEPGFNDYLKSQAINIKQMGQRDTARKALDSSRLATPYVSNMGAQEEVFPLSANKLSALLKNDKTVKNLSPAQQRVLKTAQEHARLPSRSNLGMMTGSNTAQNLNVRDAVFNDLMAAGFGEKPNLLGRVSKKAIGVTSNLLNPIIGKISTENSAALSAILTKAELNPKYAAELMKTYGLGHMNFNDNAGRAAIRAMLTQQTGK